MECYKRVTLTQIPGLRGLSDTDTPYKAAFWHGYLIKRDTLMQKPCARGHSDAET